MSDQNIKIFLALTGVAFGWLLSVVTGLIKSRHEHKAIKKALLSEIKYIRSWTDETQTTAKRMAHEVCQGVKSRALLYKIAHPVFKEHFTKICIHLDDNEMEFFNNTYRLLDGLHLHYEALAEVCSEYGLVPQAPQNKDKMINTLKRIYVDACLISLRIAHHLESNNNSGGLNLYPADTQTLIMGFEKEFAQALGFPSDSHAEQAG